MPPSHFYERHAPQKYPKEMIDRKARSIKEHLNYMNPKDGWTNIAERLENVWSRDSRSLEGLFNPKEPDLLKPVSTHFGLKKKSLQSAISHTPLWFVYLLDIYSSYHLSMPAWKMTEAQEPLSSYS